METLDRSTSEERPSKKARHQLGSEAPCNLHDVLTTQHRNAKKLVRVARQQGMSELLCQLETICKSGIVITSHYSGMGSFEMVSKQVWESIAVELGIAIPSVVCYSCTECDPVCQDLLRKLEPPAAPLHLFTDVCHHLPERSRETMQTILARWLQQTEELKKPSKAEEASRAHVTAELNRIADGLLQELRGELKDLDFQGQAFCKIHQRLCNVNPRVHYPDHFWIEASGVTCRPFSAIGSRAGWCHTSTIPCLTWLYAMRYHEPNLLLHECVPQFPMAVLEQIWNEEPLQDHPKSLHSIPLSEHSFLPDEFHWNAWEVQSHVLLTSRPRCASIAIQSLLLLLLAENREVTRGAPKL